MQIKSEADPIIGPPRMVEMQVLQERKPARSWAIAETASEPAIARMRKLELYAELKSAGGTTALCLKTIGGSKATYYRWLERYRRARVAWKAKVVVRSACAVDHGLRSRSNQCCTCAGVIPCGANASAGRGCPGIRA